MTRRSLFAALATVWLLAAYSADASRGLRAQSPLRAAEAGVQAGPSACQNSMPNEISVTQVTSNYRIASGSRSGSFVTGQDADILLSGIDFNNAGGPLLFNHPTGVATDGSRLLLADRFNNRILIWTPPPRSNADAPTLVLGQKDVQANSPGAGRDNLSWPGSVEVTATGAVVVADSYNDRVLIWKQFPTTSGQAADIELKHESLKWPWGVWTDGSRLLVSSTMGSKVLVWSSFPTADNQLPSYAVTAGDKFGTPRTITSDGRRVIVGDHNAKDQGWQVGNFVWKTFPTAATDSPDFFFSDPLDRNYAWLQGDFTRAGELLLLGRYVHRWNSFPESATQSPDLSLQAYPFDGGDGADLAIAGDRVYVSLYNGNKIVVYRQVPDTDRDPDFAVGAPDICTNTLDTNYFITNGVPASNGRSLFVSSDFDRRLYVWKNLPDESGAHPDLIYRLPEAPWDNALYGDRLVLAGQRTVYVWNRLPLAGELPDVTFKDGIGSAQFTQLRGVALDGQYFYLSDESGKVWVWDGLPSATQDPIATLTIAAPRRLNSDGTHFVVTQTDPPRILVYRVADLATSATPVVTLSNDSPGGLMMNLPAHAIVANGQLFVADTVNNRVLVWSSLDAAQARQTPSVVLGESNLQETSPQIGKNKLFWPAALSFDGAYLWVGEFKFSNRLLRFSPR